MRRKKSCPHANSIVPCLIEAAMKNREIHIGLIVPLDGLPLIVGRVYDPRLVRRALRLAIDAAARREMKDETSPDLLARHQQRLM